MRFSTLLSIVLAVFRRGIVQISAEEEPIGRQGAAKCSPVEIPVLHRGFAPGKMYNARHAKIMSGMSLWNRSQIVKDVLTYAMDQAEERKQGVAMTSSERAELMGMSRETALSAILLKDVQGSVNYLKDVLESDTVESFTVRYTGITHSYSLPPELRQMTSISHPNLLHTTKATHVVIKVAYGATAVFHFTNSLQDNQRIITGTDVKKSLSDTLKDAIKSGNESAFFKKTEDKKWAQTVSCNFHSDVPLTKIPRNAYAAMDSLATINMNVKDETSVDMKATLIPIQCVIDQEEEGNEGESYVFRSINNTIMTEIFKRIDGFEIMMRKVKDLRKTTLAQNFVGVKDTIAKYIEHCNTVNELFMDDLRSAFYAVRSVRDDRENKKAQTKLNVLLAEQEDISDMSKFKFIESRNSEDELLTTKSEERGIDYTYLTDSLYKKTNDELVEVKMKDAEKKCKFYILELDLRVLPECDKTCSLDDHYDRKKCAECLKNMGDTWSIAAFRNEFEEHVKKFKEEIDKNGKTCKDGGQSTMIVMERIEADTADIPMIRSPFQLNNATKGSNEGKE